MRNPWMTLREVSSQWSSGIARGTHRKRKKRVMSESSMPVLRGIPWKRANTANRVRQRAVRVERSAVLTSENDGQKDEEDRESDGGQESLDDTVDGCEAVG